MRAFSLTLALGMLLAGANGARAQSSGVTYIAGSTVAAAFAKGAPLIETGTYKVHASHREAAGMAEVHERDTDIIHVLDGTATFVTGGSVVEGRMTAAEEVRGASIQGGETRTLAKGDVIIVPAGTPHWFRAVQGTFLYYVVKVPDGGMR